MPASAPEEVVDTRYRMNISVGTSLKHCLSLPRNHWEVAVMRVGKDAYGLYSGAVQERACPRPGAARITDGSGQNHP